MMKRLITRLSMMVVGWLFATAAIAQSVSLDVLPKVVCVGNPTQVTAYVNGISPSEVDSFRFDWGNGDVNLNTTGTPVTNSRIYQYPTAGVYLVKVTAIFKSRAPIEASFWDTVYNRPVANFQLTSLDSQCFKYNQYCFKDLTTQAPFPSLPLRSLLLSYGDGDSDLVAPSQTICHAFGQGNRRFNVTLTTTDIGGCETKKFQTIFVAPNINPRFAVSGNPRCDTTPYIFVNNTPVSTSNLLWFRWEYGDDSVYQSQSPIVAADLPRWSNFTYKYTKNGVFNPRLIVRHRQFNCADTFDYSNSGNQLPENIVLRFDVRSRRSNSNDTIADSVCLANLNSAGVCLYNMYPLQGVNSQIQLIWHFRDPNANPPGSDVKLNEVTPCYRYQGFGHYFPQLFVLCPGQPVKTINFWSRIDTVQLNDTQYVPPPRVNPQLNTINGYFFSATDNISKYRWILGSNGQPRDSIVSYWKWFTDDPADAGYLKRENQLQGYGINVMGPLVQVEDPNVPIVIKPFLKLQCGPDLPVEFTNATNAYQSNNLFIRWDFSDDYAPRCTSFSVPNPSTPNQGREPYVSAADMQNRTLGRFIHDGVVYPGAMMCNFSHDTLPIHKYEKWSTIYRWFYHGHDFPPFDSSANGWTKNPALVTANRKLVHPLDSGAWGKPTFSQGTTPARTDTLDMWPADIQPNRRITLRGAIPDPFANSKGYWQYTIPAGTSLDTNGVLTPPLTDVLPDGTSRSAYRGNWRLPQSSKTLYEYFFDRGVAQCYTVRLLEIDSFNNQSADPIKSLERIDMVNGKIVIQQRTARTGKSDVIHRSDTFSATTTPPSIVKGVAGTSNLVGGTGYVDDNFVPATGGSGTGILVGITTGAGGAVTSVIVQTPGAGYQVNDVLTIAGGNGNATFKISAIEDILYYNFKAYKIYDDGVKHIFFKVDEKHVDAFDCGSEATVQLPLVGIDAYGLGKDGKECPGLKSGQSGGDPRFVFDNSAQNPGTFPDCGQRSYLLINYDSTLDRNDGTPCALDGFVDFAGASPMTGNTITPGGNTFPGFFNMVNFPGIPGGPWTSANGPVNWTHYIPAGPSPYTNMPKDKKGFVTVGIILGSGCLNPNANPPCTLPACLSDTVWYHNFFQFITLDASFTYRKVGGYSAYGNPSRLPSQDYTWDTAAAFVRINPTAPPPLIYANNGAFRQPWSRLFGKGDIIQFDATTKQQDYILADVWSWGDGIVTVDSFYTNKQDTLVELDPVGNPGVKAFFDKNTYPLARVRYEFETGTFPWTILSSSIPYEVGKRVYKAVRYDTIWQCWDLARQFPPSEIKVVNILIDTAFFLHPINHQYKMSSYEMPAGPGSPMKKNEITDVQHNVVTVTECSNNALRQIVIGVMDTFYMKEGDQFSDGILCIGQTVTFIDSIRYWYPKSAGPYNPSRPLDIGEEPLLRFSDMHGVGMNGYPIDTIKTAVNPTKFYSTLGTSCPNGWSFQTQGGFNFCYKIDTNFFERIYWDFESDGIVDATGKNPKHKFNKAGRFKISMITRDTVGYFDTCFMYQDVVEPVAHFNSKGIFACSDPTVFFDSSYIVDDCYLYTGTACDQIKERRWWFGDYGYGPNDYRSTLEDPFYPYRKNGWYRVMMVVETNQGCFDTSRQDIFISGPRPRIKLLSDTLGCVPYTIKVVSYPNDSGNLAATGSTLVRSGRSDGGYNTVSVNNPDTITITYDKEGVYYITAVGYDKNPPVLSTCPAIFIPDTVDGLEKPIKIYVKNPYHVEMATDKDVVCVGEIFNVKNLSDGDTITKFRMYAYNEDFTNISDTAFKTNFAQDSSFKYVFYQPGTYNLVMHSTRFIPNTPACESYDTVLVEAVKAKADLQIDSLGLPKYQVWNKSDSSLSSSYIWRVYRADGTVYSEVLVPSNDDPRFNFGLLDLKNDTGSFLVCVWAMTEGLQNCYDSACKMVSNNFTTEVEIPNVFTPDGDGQNDTYRVKISGEELFELTIWNRWGGKVFETTDAKIGWNGKVNNTGEDSPEGTYYFILKYRMRGQVTESVVRGTITMIRK